MPKKQPAARELVPMQAIQSLIYVLRGHRVMLDRDLADLYGVETRALNQAVQRNRSRFPEEFMFRLTLEEGKTVVASRSQNVILKWGENLKYAPYAFTEHGAIMLANVVKSARAVRASILVVRAFVSLRQTLTAYEGLVRKMAAIERRVGKHDTELREIIKILRRLLEPPPPEPPKRPIGFLPPSARR
jgi:ORF6N domain